MESEGNVNWTEGKSPSEVYKMLMERKIIIFERLKLFLLPPPICRRMQKTKNQKQQAVKINKYSIISLWHSISRT